MVTLPTADELGKLPLRALVAYASGAAYRLCSVLHGHPAESIVNKALSLSMKVVSAKPITNVDIDCLLGAAIEVATVLESVREDKEKYPAVFSVINAARTAWSVLIVASGFSVLFSARIAARAADAAARAAELLAEPEATYAIETAHRDYIALLDIFGEQTGIVIGEAFIWKWE